LGKLEISFESDKKFLIGSPESGYEIEIPIVVKDKAIVMVRDIARLNEDLRFIGKKNFI